MTQKCYSLQFKDIKKGGISVFGGKFSYLISIVFDKRDQIQMLASIPFVIVMRLLPPIVILRFGPLLNGRIGHLSGNTELHIF